MSLAKEVQGMDVVNEDKAIKNAVLLWILENPVMYLRRLPDNFRSFWWETGRYTMTTRRHTSLGENSLIFFCSFFVSPPCSRT